ncbi:MAG: hypothetical protein WCS94_05365 [Verrucomicrobiota bacterium]
MKKLLKVYTAAGLVAIAASTSQAQPYYVVGEYNGWSNPSASPMTGGPLQYDFTITGQTPGAYAQFKVTDGTWSTTWPGNNQVIRYDTNGSVTIHFYPGTAGDGWLPLANRVGYDDPGTLDSWGMAGDFDGWNGNNTLLASIGNGAYSNSIVAASAGTYQFKFQSPAGSWNNIYFGTDFGNNNANGSFTTTNSPQTLPVVLDLPKGRYLIGSLAPSPVTNQVVFAVDMTYQIQLGLFHPGSSVFVAGGFNGWPGTGAGALALVNDPPYRGGSNTNIYYGTNLLVGLPKSLASEFKYTQNDANSQNGGWETSNNRTVTLLSSNGTVWLPVGIFSDLYPTEVLSVPTAVFFSINMSNAVGTDAHPFDPTADNVYVNGQFSGWYAWSGGINPASAPAGYQMIAQGDSLIYTNTILLPAGTSIAFDYKYGMDINAANGGPADNEAGFAQNHHRVIRSTAISPYVLATDTFGTQYAEPLFAAASPAGANLKVGSPAAGRIPVSWLGRPGAHLQVKSALTGGDWQDLTATDGSTWSAGYNSINGLVSVTNWPATDKAYFRLVKP